MKLKVIRVITASYVIPWHLHNTLIRASEDFEVFVIGDNVSSYQEKYKNIHFIDIKIDRKTALLSDILAFFKLLHTFKTIKPDIIHSIMPKSGLLSCFAGFICAVPTRIHTFTGQTWATKKGLPYYAHYGADRIINKLNTICLTDSPSQSKFLFENHFAHNKEPLPVLSQGSLSGVDTNRFQKEKLTHKASHIKQQLNIQDDTFIFSFIARKTRDKGAIDILQAFSKLSTEKLNIKLLFIGPYEDKETTSLKSESPHLFKNVIDIGQVSNHEEYLAITNILCLPSYREGFGSIVIDAASMGVPTIGSRIPGLVDAIQDQETGMLFPAGDIEEISRIMKYLVTDRVTCRLMGENAKKRVDKFFTADTLYQTLKEFYIKAAKHGV